MSCIQTLTKAYGAKTPCNEVVIDSAMYVLVIALYCILGPTAFCILLHRWCPCSQCYSCAGFGCGGGDYRNQLLDYVQKQ